MPQSSVQNFSTIIFDTPLSKALPFQVLKLSLLSLTPTVEWISCVDVSLYFQVLISLVIKTLIFPSPLDRTLLVSLLSCDRAGLLTSWSYVDSFFWVSGYVLTLPPFFFPSSSFPILLKSFSPT